MNYNEKLIGEYPQNYLELRQNQRHNSLDIYAEFQKEIVTVYSGEL